MNHEGCIKFGLAACSLIERSSEFHLDKCKFTLYIELEHD